MSKFVKSLSISCQNVPQTAIHATPLSNSMRTQSEVTQGKYLLWVVFAARGALCDALSCVAYAFSVFSWGAKGMRMVMAVPFPTVLSTRIFPL